MKTIVFSGKYIKIIKYFAILYNKYFDSNNQVFVLCSEDSQGNAGELPKNFTLYPCVKQTSSSWVEDIYPFFENFNEPYFHGCMEDHFLYSQVDIKIMAEAETLIQNGKIDKLVTNHPNYRFNSYKIESFKICSLADQEGPTSLLPSIWRTDLFKEMLNNVRGKTAWDFELENMKHLNILNAGRYKFAYYPIDPEFVPYPSVDLIRKGSDNYSFWSKYVKDQEDIQIFNAARKEVFEV